MSRKYTLAFQLIFAQMHTKALCQTAEQHRTFTAIVACVIDLSSKYCPRLLPVKVKVSMSSIIKNCVLKERKKNNWVRYYIHSTPPKLVGFATFHSAKNELLRHALCTLSHTANECADALGSGPLSSKVQLLQRKCVRHVWP